MTPADLDALQALADAAVKDATYEKKHVRDCGGCSGVGHTDAENEALDNDLTKMSAEYVRWRDECRRIALERDALRAQVERLENVEHEFVLKFADKDAELARAEGEIDRLEEALKFLRAVQEEQIRSCVGDYDFANENSKLRLENTSLKAEMARLVLAREGE